MEILKVRINKPSYINNRSKSAVQAKRLDNYSDLLLDILEDYAEEIDSSIVPYNKKSVEETMMIKGLRKSSQETTNRKTHMENVEGIAVEIAKKLGLHIGTTRIIARNHDIGHTFLGHSGEWWLSNVKEDYGMGYYTHNALGPAELIYRQRIKEQILERIKEYNPNIKESELSRIAKSLWLIFDGINSHNGEKTESEFIPDKGKNEGKFLEELQGCFVKKGYDKTIMPATIEGCLIRLCDKISYVPYDMVDGLREGIIDEIDEEYAKVLTSLGISEEEIERCNIKRNYEPIARKLQIIFTKDVIQNSSKGKIKMSNGISKAMHELRNINNKRIVKYAVLQEDEATYPEAIRTLMKRFSSILLSSNNLQTLYSADSDLEISKRLLQQYKGTPDEEFVRYVSEITPGEYEFTLDYITKATRQAIEDEQDQARQAVLSGKDFLPSNQFKKKGARIQRYIKYYKAKGITDDYSEEDKARDIDEEYARQMQPDAEYPNLKEKMALEFAARYLSTLNDFEFFNLLKSTNIITEEQARSLTRSYKGIGQEGLRKEVFVQEEFSEIMKSQEEETGKISQSSEQAEEMEL